MPDAAIRPTRLWAFPGESEASSRTHGPGGENRFELLNPAPTRAPTHLPATGQRQVSEAVSWSGSQQSMTLGGE